MRLLDKSLGSCHISGVPEINENTATVADEDVPNLSHVEVEESPIAYTTETSTCLYCKLTSNCVK